MKSVMMAMVVLAGVAVAGCNRPLLQKPGEVQGDPIAIDNYPNVVAEGDLDKWLVVSRAIAESAQDKPLRVTVPIRNGSKVELSVQYRFEFLDATGRPLDTTPRWQYMRMPVATQVFFQGAALDTTATDWRLIIRPAR